MAFFLSLAIFTKVALACMGIAVQSPPTSLLNHLIFGKFIQKALKSSTSITYMDSPLGINYTLLTGTFENQLQIIR